MVRYEKKLEKKIQIIFFTSQIKLKITFAQLKKKSNVDWQHSATHF